MIALAQGGMELDVAPEIGGSVTRLAFEGTDVLRPAPKGAFVQCNACTFALVPYANRIENGVFHFRGREIRLSRNFGDHPHSLHGHGWQTAWRVASLSRDQVTLAYDYEAADWPWTYSAEQVLTLADGGFTHRLTVRSRDAKAMPASLGFHPYFPCTATTRLTATVAGMWKADFDHDPDGPCGGIALARSCPRCAGGQGAVRRQLFYGLALARAHRSAGQRLDDLAGSVAGMHFFPHLYTGRTALLRRRAGECHAQRLQPARAGEYHWRKNAWPRRKLLHRDAHSGPQALGACLRVCFFTTDSGG